MVSTLTQIDEVVPELTSQMNEAADTVRKAFRPDRSKMKRLTPEQQVTRFFSTPMNELDELIQRRGPDETERYLTRMMQLAQDQGRL